MNRLSTHQTDELVNSIVGLLASSRYDFTQLLDQINALQSVGVVGGASDDWIDVNRHNRREGLEQADLDFTNQMFVGMFKSMAKHGLIYVGHVDVGSGQHVFKTWDSNKRYKVVFLVEG